MADNLTVLNSTGGTFTIRMTDVGAGVLANNSIPTSTSGSPMSVQAGAAVVSTAQGAAVVVISSLSPTHTVILSSNPTVIPSSAVQVTLTSNVVALSSNPTITSVTSGSVSIIAGANTANVLAGSSTVTSTMAALVVAISSNGAGVIGTGVFGTTPSSQVLSVQGSSIGTPVATIYSTTGLGGTTSSLSAPVVPADQYGGYTVVGASNTQLSLGTSAGRAGDYLAYLTVFPSVAASGAVTIFDSTTTTIGGYAGGGTTPLPSLVPFRIDVGAYSVSSGWKVTTSSNISALAVGKFT